MKMNNKRHLKKLIKESVEKEIIWQKFCESAISKRNLLIRKGYAGKNLDESFAGIVNNLVTAFFGSGIMSGGDLGQSAGNFKTIVKQQVLHYIVEKMGFSNKTALGSIVRNSLEEAFETLSDEEFKEMIKSESDRCIVISRKVSDVFINALRNGLTERGFDSVLSNFMGDFEGLKDSKMFGGVYISIREKLSKTVEMAINEILKDQPKLVEDMTDLLCDSDLVTIILEKNPDAKIDIDKIYNKILGYFGT
jgi:hypothetical protein